MDELSTELWKYAIYTHFNKMSTTQYSNISFANHIYPHKVTSGSNTQ